MNKIFILFVATATMMVGCGKDDKDPIEDNGCKVVKIVEDEDYVTNLSYDNDGKLADAIFSFEGSSDGKLSFSYSSGKIIATSEYDGVFTSTLNSQGLVSSAKYDNVTYTFSYDGNGYLTKMVYKTNDNYELIEELSYSNGNLVSIDYKAQHDAIVDY